jgi:tetratricopeptide (TPR) repeat protein
MAAGVVALLALAAPALAQIGGVQGSVVDEVGEPVEDAAISLLSLGGSPVEQETRSDAEGRYTQIGLRAGPYRITVSKEGYRGASFESRVEAGQTTGLPDVRIISLEAARADAADSDANKRIAELFDRALERADAGDYEAAEAALLEALELRPKFPEAHLNLGVFHMQRERWDEAEGELKTALEQRPDYPAARVALSNLYQKTGREAEAQQMMQSVADSGGGDAQSFLNLGLVKLNAQDQAGATEAFLEAEKRDPELAEAQYYLGTLALGRGETDETIRRLERYLSLGPQNEQNRATAEGLLAALKK